MKNSENNLITNLIINIDNAIKKVAKENQYYKLENLFEPITNCNEKNKIYESIINHYLEILKDFEILDIQSFFKNVEYVSCFFDYAYFAYDNNIKRRYYLLQENGEDIADGLIAKCCKYSDNNLDLPVSLDIIKKYLINYEVKTTENEKVLLWIILRLGISCYFLTNK